MKSFFPEKWRPSDWFLLFAVDGLSSALAWSFVVMNSAGSRTSPRNGCIANLKQMDGAVQYWASEHRKTTNDNVVLTEVVRYLKGSQMPRCPLKGSYQLPKTSGELPRCSILGHTL